MITVHAACCVVDGAGVLIRGPSGAGKSSLALFLAAAQDGAFVADDRVICAVEAGRLVARPHAALAGHVEVQDRPVLHLAVDLVDAAPRMPDAPGDADLLGIALPRFVLDAGVRAAGLAPLLIRAALRQKRP
jgi:ABC-type taurine transport system ATPase subunit